MEPEGVPPHDPYQNLPPKTVGKFWDKVSNGNFPHCFKVGFSLCLSMLLGVLNKF